MLRRSCEEDASIVRSRALASQEEPMLFEMPKYQLKRIQDKNLMLQELPDGVRVLKRFASTVIRYMPIIGMKEITEENCAETCRRIEEWEKFIGPDVEWIKDEPVDILIYEEDIRNMIGLEVECETVLSNTEWDEKITSMTEKRDREAANIDAYYPKLPKNPKIEDLAPGAVLHTEGIIPMSEIAKKIGA